MIKASMDSTGIGVDTKIEGTSMEVAYQLYAILLAVNDCDPEIVKVIVPEALKDIAKKKGEEEHAENRQPA